MYREAADAAWAPDNTSTTPVNAPQLTTQTTVTTQQNHTQTTASYPQPQPPAQPQQQQSQQQQQLHEQQQRRHQSQGPPVPPYSQQAPPQVSSQVQGAFATAEGSYPTAFQHNFLPIAPATAPGHHQLPPTPVLAAAQSATAAGFKPPRPAVNPSSRVPTAGPAISRTGSNQPVAGSTPLQQSGLRQSAPGMLQMQGVDNNHVSSHQAPTPPNYPVHQHQPQHHAGGISSVHDESYDVIVPSVAAQQLNQPVLLHTRPSQAVGAVAAQQHSFTPAAPASSFHAPGTVPVHDHMTPCYDHVAPPHDQVTPGQPFGAERTATPQTTVVNAAATANVTIVNINHHYGRHQQSNVPIHTDTSRQLHLQPRIAGNAAPGGSNSSTAVDMECDDSWAGDGVYHQDYQEEYHDDDQQYVNDEQVVDHDGVVCEEDPTVQCSPPARTPGHGYAGATSHKLHAIPQHDARQAELLVNNMEEAVEPGAFAGGGKCDSADGGDGGGVDDDDMQEGLGVFGSIHETHEDSMEWHDDVEPDCEPSPEDAGGILNEPDGKHVDWAQGDSRRMQLGMQGTLQQPHQHCEEMPVIETDKQRQTMAWKHARRAKHENANSSSAASAGMGAGEPEQHGTLCAAAQPGQVVLDNADITISSSVGLQASVASSKSRMSGDMGRRVLSVSQRLSLTQQGSSARRPDVAQSSLPSVHEPPTLAGAQHEALAMAGHSGTDIDEIEDTQQMDDDHAVLSHHKSWQHQHQHHPSTSRCIHDANGFAVKPTDAAGDTNASVQGARLGLPMRTVGGTNQSNLHGALKNLRQQTAGISPLAMQPPRLGTSPSCSISPLVLQHSMPAPRSRLSAGTPATTTFSSITARTHTSTIPATIVVNAATPSLPTSHILNQPTTIKDSTAPAAVCARVPSHDRHATPPAAAVSGAYDALLASMGVDTAEPSAAGSWAVAKGCNTQQQQQQQHAIDQQQPHHVSGSSHCHQQQAAVVTEVPVASRQPLKPLSSNHTKSSGSNRLNHSGRQTDIRALVSQPVASQLCNQAPLGTSDSCGLYTASHKPHLQLQQAHYHQNGVSESTRASEECMDTVVDLTSDQDSETDHHNRSQEHLSCHNGSDLNHLGHHQEQYQQQQHHQHLHSYQPSQQHNSDQLIAAGGHPQDGPRQQPGASRLPVSKKPSPLDAMEAELDAYLDSKMQELDAVL